MERSKKSELRSQIRSMRESLEECRGARMNLEILVMFREALKRSESACVYSYVSFRREADTFGILKECWNQGVRTAVPKVMGQELIFHYIQSFEDLEPGCMGIWEPKEDCVVAEDLNCPVIVPGLAFDREGYRLGYGGGYYDRFFKREPSHLKIGIGFEFQMVERVPREAWDRPVDLLLIAGMDGAKEVRYDID